MDEERTDRAARSTWARLRSRPPAWLIRLFVGLAGLAVLVGVLEWLEWPFLRRPVESALRHILEREVSIGPDFGVRFIGPLRLRSDLLVIGPAPGGPNLTDHRGQDRDLLRAADLRLALPYATLFALRDGTGKAGGDKDEPRRRPVIDRLEVSRLHATLVRSEDGRANWRFGPQDDREPTPLPEFGRLLMTGGEILVDDALSRLKLEAEVRTSEGTAAAMPPDAQASGLDISARGSYRGQVLSARLRSSGLLPIAESRPGLNSDSRSRAPAVPLRLEARLGSSALDFDGSGRDVLNLAALSGKFRLSGPSLAAVGDNVGVTLPTTTAFTMQGYAVKDGDIWTVDIAELSVGRSRLNGTFRYDPTRRVPKLTGKLGGARLSLPDLGPAVGASPRPRTAATAAAKAARAADNTPPRAAAKAATRPAASGPRVLPQREFDIPSLGAMDADVMVALDEFDLGTAQLEKMAPLQTHAVLENRVLTLRDLVARTSGGEVRGMLSLDARKATAIWRADLSWSGVRLERFVKLRNPAARDTTSDIASNSSPDTTPNTDRADRAKRPTRTEPAAPGYVSGLLGGRARVQGSGRSAAQMLATLDGEAQVWVRDGQISHLLVELTGLDIAEALGIFVRGDAQLPMHCAVAGLNVRAGKVWPEAAVIETSDTTLHVAGVVSLADERLDLVFKAQPKDQSPLTLRSPVFVEGTFADPEVRFDTGSIGMRLAAAAALAAATPLAALLALFDLGEPEKRVCQEAIQRMQRFPEPASGGRRKR